MEVVCVRGAVCNEKRRVEYNLYRDSKSALKDERDGDMLNNSAKSF